MMEYVNEEAIEEEMISALPDYAEEIAALIRGDLAPKALSERLSEYHDKDIASALTLLTEDQRGKLYRVLNNDVLSGVIEYSDERNTYLGELELKRRIALLAMIEIGDAAEYLKSLPRGERSSILSLLPDDTRKELTVISAFEEDEIGSRMSTNYISVVGGIGVREAMRELVTQAAENDNVSTIYVTDADGEFVGAISLKNLILARAGTPLDDVITVSYPYVYAFEQTDVCLERIRGYSEDSIPVLDRENRLIGVLTATELAELIEDEMSEDYARLAGLAAEEELQEPLKRSVAKRLPWLAVLFALGLAVSWVVGLFEAVADAVPVIVSFQSLILGMAGNVGTQSLAVTVRLLADEHLSPAQKAYLVFKEARVGMVNGLVLGTVSLLAVGGYIFLIHGVLAFAIKVAFCTAAALLISMLLSGIFGASIPLLLKKMGVDPAVASGPFITTVNDLVAVVTYYGMAIILLM